jgi:hypothetical protein
MDAPSWTYCRRASPAVADCLHRNCVRANFPRRFTPGWWVLLEAPLLRLGKRLDAVVLGPGLVIVVEFKIGAMAYAAAR